MIRKLNKIICDNYEGIIFFTIIPLVTNAVLFFALDDMFDFFHSPDYRDSLIRASVIIITHTILAIPLLFIDYAIIRVAGILLEDVKPEAKR